MIIIMIDSNLYYYKYTSCHIIHEYDYFQDVYKYEKITYQVFKFFIMYLIILVILINELITASNGEDIYCMSECNCNCNCNCQASRNEQSSQYEQPSLYEQHCCNLRNVGNTIKIEDGKFRTKIICPSDLPISCFQFYNYSCSQIHQVYPSTTSGYYNITLTNGSIVTVYCDMEGINCDEEGGWTRVAYLNMTEPGTTCPSGLTQRGYSNINHDVCGRPSDPGCDSTTFSTYGLNYTKVCGQIRGYQFAIPDAFHLGSKGIDSYYVEGVSITYGSNPRQHIWTYAGGFYETRLDSRGCPCNSGSAALPPPSFVGNDYYCESGLNAPPYPLILYPFDPLWDGQNCNGPESTCCTNPNMPWFLKTLNEVTTHNIELRVCCSHGLPYEDTPLDIIEIYVK